MSRSRKKPIIKDAGYREYNRRYRRVCNSLTRKFFLEDDLALPDTRSVTNSYDVSDWQFRAWDERTRAKFSRK